MIPWSDWLMVQHEGGTITLSCPCGAWEYTAPGPTISLNWVITQHAAAEQMAAHALEHIRKDTHA